MDIAFSRTPQILIPLSPASLRYAPSSSTGLPATRLGPVRRDFLGSSDSTRPPGVRMRRRGWWRYEVKLRPARVAVTSALSSGTVFLGVAVVSVSVAAVVVFDSMQRRMKIEKAEGHSDDAASKASNGTISRGKVDTKPVVDLEEVVAHLGSENVSEERQEESEVLGDSESTLFSQDFVQIPQEAVHAEAPEEVEVSGHESRDLTPIAEETIETLEESFFGAFVSDADDSVRLEMSEAAHLPIVVPLISDEAVNDLSAVELFNGQAHAHLDEHEVVLGSSTLQLSCISSAGTSGHKLDAEHEVEAVQHVEEVTGSDVFVRSSVRADLYTFFEENKFVLNGVSSSESLAAMSSNGHSMNGGGFSPVAGAVAPKQIEPSVNGKSQFTELERNGASFKSSHKGKDLEGGDKGFARAKAKGLLTFTNGTHVNYDSPTDYYDGYQRLLRNGRLKDCVNLLEEMERKNLLDMDKVYHSRFFQTCRRQKSVVEAFRFANLIPNPTLSTFNMLMSVCASSQDLEGAFRVLRLVQGSGQKPDCKLYTTLISTCAKCGKVDRMFEVFHEMVNAKVEPNVNTYGALIDGCARAGQVPKAFGAYGIMRSK
uniref:Pentatricopeptide repeat-containing protein n=1 Tax=Kalanchoe fedtschenkoi TaxID=63787 RepID=A0A7N0T839_KALFE